jgi:hypothetical protein
MPKPQYRGRAATAELGDFVAGWRDAESTEEIAGVVVDMAPEQAAGDNVTLAVLEHDPYPKGGEPPPQEGPGKGVVGKAHDGTPYVLNLRLVVCNSERLELKYRRAGLEGWAGVLRQPHPDVLRARHGQDDLRRRQAEQAAGGAPATPPAQAIAARPPEPLPEPKPGEPKPAATQPPHAPARDESRGGRK